MTRMSSLWTLLTLFLFGCGQSCTSGEDPGATEPLVTKPGDMKYNVLFIAVDTLRASHLGAYGYPKPTSPNIDSLFAESIQFDEAMSTAPWTLPSFATMLTSQYTSTHGCWDFDDTLDPSFPTLPEQLADAGYHTGAVVGHIFLGSKFGLQQGFEYYDESLVLDTLGNSHLAITSEVITDKSISFLEQHATERGDQPWLLWTHYFDPHNKYQPHKGITPTFGSNRKARYDGEIAYTDQHVGRLLQYLKDHGMYDNTVIIFVSDHGEEFKDHGSILHGKTLFREVIRVPMAIRVPGVAAKQIKQLVGTIDLMPTVLDVLNVPGPDIPMSGQSLTPLFRGKSIEPRPLLLETYQNKTKNASLKGIITPEWKLIIETPYESVRERDNLQTVTRLYRISKDPREKRNLAKQRKDLVEKLDANLEGLIATAAKHRERYTIGEQTEHSAEETRQLEMLGYISGPNE